jgi:adenine-specific DNA methylase
MINQIFKTGEVPNMLKRGLLTPIFKNKGSKKVSTYYRGITILPVMNKIIEATIKLRINTTILDNQNPAQRGFTAKTSPLNAAFIIEELKREAKDNNNELFIVLLDARSVFDVVNTDHLLRRLYQIGINDKTWNIIHSLHDNAVSAVKWNGIISEFFNISEGVRQGAILNADLYKVYVNPLLERLNRVGVGARIGDITCNTTACADDVTLNTTDFNDAQVLLTIAEDFASQERYQLQPTKTNTIQVKFSQRKQSDKIKQSLQMKSDDIPNVTEATHIGLQQTCNFKKSGEINVDNNIKKARRATYSLMSSGFHGHNGLDPETTL